MICHRSTVDVFAIRQPPQQRPYTAVVGSFTVRVVSLMMIVALAGTPAVAATCAALCTPAIAHSSSTGAADTADRHATHGTTSRAEAQANNTRGAQAPGHHHSLAQEMERARNPPRVGAVELTGASDHSCCTSDDTVLTAAVAAVRADTRALLTTAVLATPFHLLIPLRSEPKYSAPIAPPSPPRAPLVLRV